MNAIQPINSKPILFKGVLVQATLDGVKTVTRRLPRKPIVSRDGARFFVATDPKKPRSMEPEPLTMAEIVQRCPYGQPGDELWVRETWAMQADEGSEDALVRYCVPRRDLGKWIPTKRTTGALKAADGTRVRQGRYMPRWASRITLEVAEVALERIQTISTNDIVAEGAIPWLSEIEGWPNGPPSDAELKNAFARGWDSINADREELHRPTTWARNPWVWVVRYRIKGVRL